jgi:hypothetical protein
VGVIVASSRGLPEDKPLRFAYQDGEKLERLLSTVGHVEPPNLFYVRSERREALLSGIAEAGARVDALKRAGRKVFLQFYYTGHGAARHFHLEDGPISFDEVKGSLGGTRADARVYVLDVCYGASFFTAKGFRTAPPLQLQLQLDQSARGEVTISSSAGDEQAYEVRTLGGSIFTSHWIMALRGAGDRNRDGQVSLFEAYNYAYDRTSGYSAETLARPQHPSFQIDLTGARDMQLARLLKSTTGLLFRDCPPGKYNVLDLQRGQAIGELRVPEGEEFTLALDQGRYRVQYLPPVGRALSADVTLPDEGMTPLPFSAFAPAPIGPGNPKGPDGSPGPGPDGSPGPGSGHVPDSGPGDGPELGQDHGPVADPVGGPSGPSRRIAGAGGRRWILSSALGAEVFRDATLGESLREDSPVDGYFGLGGAFRKPTARPSLVLDLAYAPNAGPWSLGLRLAASRADWSRRGEGREPLPSLPDSARAAFPVLLRSSHAFSDLRYGAFAGRAFRLGGRHTLGLDVAGSLIHRAGESERTVERTLYETRKTLTRTTQGKGWRAEAGLAWWFHPEAGGTGGAGSLSVGLKLSPYYQSVDERGAEEPGRAQRSRETGASLSLTLSLGRGPVPARNRP